MSTSKPAIVVRTLDPATRRTLDEIKETIEIITARRGSPIATLPASAPLADVVAKVNELLGLLQ